MKEDLANAIRSVLPSPTSGCNDYMGKGWRQPCSTGFTKHGKVVSNWRLRRTTSMPLTFTTGGELQTEDRPLLPPVIPEQVKLVTHQCVPLRNWRPNTRTHLPGFPNVPRCQTSNLRPEEVKFQEKLEDWQQHWKRLQTSCWGLDWQSEHGLGTQKQKKT